MDHNKYYDRLKTVLNEELGINFRGYQANKTAQRKGRLYQKQLQTRPEMSWSGDSATVEDLPAKRQSDGGVDPTAAVKNKVIELMTKAQSQGIQMTHGEAHRMAMKMQGL